MELVKVARVHPTHGVQHAGAGRNWWWMSACGAACIKGRVVLVENAIFLPSDLAFAALFVCDVDETMRRYRWKGISLISQRP
jgi:hypothetical protein